MPTFVLIAANVAVYAYTSVLSRSLTTSETVIDAFGQYNQAVFNGEVWRLFTAIFIHADIVHIFGNMLFLLIFGLRAEDMFDVKEYMLIYFGSGLSGSLLSLAFGPDSISIGASGAIFGVLGAAVIGLALINGRRSLGSIMFALAYAFFFLVINIGPNVDYLAHLGGLAAGLLIGYALASSRRYKPLVTYQHNYPRSWST